MSEVYSNMEDCMNLSKILLRRLRGKIDFYGSLYTEVPSGKYLSSYRRNMGEYLFNGQCLPFYFKYSADNFFRISVGSNYLGSSMGEKLAALSDFYEVLRNDFGEPTVFYTTKDDNEKLLSFQWSFTNKEEDIKRFKDGTYFDDAEIEQLIVIGEDNKDDKKKNLNETAKKMISKCIYLPFDFFELIIRDDIFEDFIKFKSGNDVYISENTTCKVNKKIRN